MALGLMVTISGVAWGLFWLFVGRNLHSFDFAASTTRGPQEPFSSPTYVFVLLGWYVALVVLAAGIPGIIAGAALLRGRPWARRLAIVVSAVDILLLFPVHALLGIYGLVILLNPEGKRVASGTINGLK